MFLNKKQKLYLFIMYGIFYTSNFNFILKFASYIELYNCGFYSYLYTFPNLKGYILLCIIYPCNFNTPFYLSLKFHINHIYFYRKRRNWIGKSWTFTNWGQIPVTYRLVYNPNIYKNKYKYKLLSHINNYKKFN